MDILKSLVEAKNELYPEDLDFFEVELATGDYDQNYIDECRKEIVRLRLDAVQAANVKPSAEESVGSSWFMSRGHIFSESEKPVTQSVPEQVFSHIQVLRKTQNYKTDFRKYIKRNVEINEEFIDKNFALFQPWELAAIASLKQLSEEFLEKYFTVLDKKMIAKYQSFSEGFFMKHYAELDARLVLTKGKNEWRKKQNRSKQLDIFLRLKGVKF